MGCGCNKSRSINTKSEQSNDCIAMYEELRDLDLKRIELETNLGRTEELVEVGVKLRGWINNLRNGCPNEMELEVIKKYVLDEYRKYIS